MCQVRSADYAAAQLHVTRRHVPIDAYDIGTIFPVERNIASRSWMPHTGGFASSRDPEPSTLEDRTSPSQVDPVGIAPDISILGAWIAVG
jgi:hypothetical protein